MALQELAEGRKEHARDELYLALTSNPNLAQDKRYLTSKLAFRAYEVAEMAGAESGAGPSLHRGAAFIREFFALTGGADRNLASLWRRALGEFHATCAFHSSRRKHWAEVRRHTLKSLAYDPPHPAHLNIGMLKRVVRSVVRPR
jgi:hypothetical protein